MSAALFDAIAAGDSLPADLRAEALDQPKAEPPYDGFTPLGLALFVGNHAAAQALLDAGASIEAPNAEGRSPLLFLAGRKEETALTGIDWLLRHGADATATTAKGVNALHEAAWDGGFFPGHFVRIAERLLAAGTSPSATTAQGNTPLHYAVRSHATELMRLLVRHGANVDARTLAGATALHMVAVNYASWRALDEQHAHDSDDSDDIDATSLAHDCIQTLLELGARKDLETQEGSSALALARLVEMPDELLVLLEP
jgi:ankyrin repeat protein